jgi:hypothetical protein
MSKILIHILLYCNIYLSYDEIDLVQGRLLQVLNNCAAYFTKISMKSFLEDFFYKKAQLLLIWDLGKLADTFL